MDKDKVMERLERLETQWLLLNEENSASKVTLRILERRVRVSEQMNEQLSDRRESSPSENVVDVDNSNKRIRELEKKVTDLEQQHQLIQDCYGNFRKMKKLQLILNGAILKSTSIHQRDNEIEGMSSRLDCMNKILEDLQVNAGNTSTQMDEMNSRCTSIHKEVEDLQANAGHTSIQMDEMNSRCTLIHKKVENLQANADDTSTKMDEMNSRCDSMHKDVEDLQAYAGCATSQMNEMNSRCTWIHKKVEGLQAITGSISSQMNEMKSLSNFIHKTVKDLQTYAGQTASQMDQLNSSCFSIHKEVSDAIQREFVSHMELVENHQLLLFVNDYWKMAALESIAGIPNGPAFKFLTNWNGGESKEAESDRQVEVMAHRTKGITTADQAMSEYVKLRGQATSCRPGTEFHLIHSEAYGDCILALDQSCLCFLDYHCKTAIQSWSVSDISSCAIPKASVELKFSEGKTIEFDTAEEINSQVQERISSLLRK